MSLHAKNIKKILLFMRYFSERVSTLSRKLILSRISKKSINADEIRLRLLKNKRSVPRKIFRQRLWITLIVSVDFLHEISARTVRKLIMHRLTKFMSFLKLEHSLILSCAFRAKFFLFSSSKNRCKFIIFVICTVLCKNNLSTLFKDSS